MFKQPYQEHTYTCNAAVKIYETTAATTKWLPAIIKNLASCT